MLYYLVGLKFRVSYNVLVFFFFQHQCTWVLISPTRVTPQKSWLLFLLTRLDSSLYPRSTSLELSITTSRRFKCVPQILGLSSIHIFRLLFLPLLITFRRIHERNSFDLGAICLFCFEFCCLIDFLIPIVT